METCVISALKPQCYRMNAKIEQYFGTSRFSRSMPINSPKFAAQEGLIIQYFILYQLSLACMLLYEVPFQS